MVTTLTQSAETLTYFIILTLGANLKSQDRHILYSMLVVQYFIHTAPTTMRKCSSIRVLVQR